MEIEAISGLKQTYRQQVVQQDYQYKTEEKRIQSELPLTVSKSWQSNSSANQETGKSDTDSFSSDETAKREKVLELIQRKIDMGGKLTEDEKELLEKYDPSKYQKIYQEEQEIRSYEIDLSRARTRQDVVRVKFHHAAVAYKMESSGSVNVPENIKRIEVAENLSESVANKLMEGEISEYEDLHHVDLEGSSKAAFDA